MRPQLMIAAFVMAVSGVFAYAQTAERAPSTQPVSPKIQEQISPFEERRESITPENTQVVAVLNDLIQVAHDGERRFQLAVQGTTDTDLQGLFHRYADQRASFVEELEGQVRRLEGKPAGGGTVFGSMHRGWLNMKHAFSRSDEAVLKECERGEAAALQAYDIALQRADLPSEIRSLIKRQREDIETTRESLLGKLQEM